jgi:hypothetical protein
MARLVGGVYGSTQEGKIRGRSEIVDPRNFRFVLLEISKHNKTGYPSPSSELLSVLNVCTNRLNNYTVAWERHSTDCWEQCCLRLSPFSLLFHFLQSPLAYVSKPKKHLSQAKVIWRLSLQIFVWREELYSYITFKNVCVATEFEGST